MTSIEALQEICGYYYQSPEYKLIAKELGLLNALRNKLNRKVETKEYKNEASNSYHISVLLTYELKERWDDMELQALKQFLLNLSGISKELKALEIIKPYCIVADYKCENPEDRYELAFCKKVCITEEEYDLLKEILNGN